MAVDGAVDPALVALLHSLNGQGNVVAHGACGGGAVGDGGNGDDVAFVVLPSGRVRCTWTGHELVASTQQVQEYANSRRFAAAKAERQLRNNLRQFEPHIVQSPQFKDKLLCTLTGKLVCRSEAAVWKHMLGSKFRKCLEKKEREKGIKPRGEQMVEDGEGLTEGEEVKGGAGQLQQQQKKKEKGGKLDRGSRAALVKMDGDFDGLELEPKQEKRAGKEKKREKLGNVETSARKLPSKSKELQRRGKGRSPSESREAEVEGGESKLEGEGDDSGVREAVEERKNEEGSSEGEAFWVPPVGERWDGDTGGPRWDDVEGNDEVVEDEDGMGKVGAGEKRRRGEAATAESVTSGGKGVCSGLGTPRKRAKLAGRKKETRARGEKQRHKIRKHKVIVVPGSRQSEH